MQIEFKNKYVKRFVLTIQEADSTFHILLNESTRRLKLLTKKLGNCIEKSAPYYESLEKARLAQIQCQVVAAKFQRANGWFVGTLYLSGAIILNDYTFLVHLEIHAAAKETVALAEERFLSNSHNWTFDNTWQEMLNHATNKVNRI